MFLQTCFVYDRVLHGMHVKTRQEAFLMQLEIVVTKKNTQKVVIDEQWVTEQEMKQDLKWTATLDYIRGMQG